jgi:hypothetical protein
MKLVYSKSRCNQADVVHRFDVLGDLLPSDLDVLRASLFKFFEQLGKSEALYPVVVLDISEGSIKVNEAKLQAFVSELKSAALASKIFIGVAQTDIESMHAEQKTMEQALINQINLLENKLNLMESIKEKIHTISEENEDLREKLKESKPSKTARSLFEKLWGET